MSQTDQEKKVALKPLGNRVLAKRQEEESVKGGIILPDSAKKKPEHAVIVAVGPGKKDSEGNLVTPGVQVGDTILMEKYSGQEVTLQDEEYVVVRGEDIIAIVDVNHHVS